MSKCYILEMFPYPSGKLHPGHLRNYTIGDIYTRFKKAKQFDILHPMGFDAFGLPAENAAIQNKTSPKTWTESNISTMRSQLKKMQFLYDWSNEINTSSVEYYKHEQRIFIDMFKAGLVYQEESYVNWDPVDQTVLANEQVVNGKGWRSGATIEKKKLKQWFVKITDYAEELLSSLDDLEDWPEQVKTQQREWIGKSEGVEINFNIYNTNDTISVFTTRPETIFGASFIGLSSEHSLVEKLRSVDPNIEEFVKKLESISKIDLAKNKFGLFTGIYAKHPFMDKKIPIWICSFVLMNHGHGAIFGCPAHDQRDYEFAKQYDLEINQVIIQEEYDQNGKPLQEYVFDDTTMYSEIENINSNPMQIDPDMSMKTDYDIKHEDKLPYTSKDGIMVQSDFLNGLKTHEAQGVVLKKLEEMKIGKSITTYKLKNWGVSRQRYWGCPIPIIHCDTCGPVPNENLPVELPEDINFEKGHLSLNQFEEWKKTTCPKCHKPAAKETDTLDTFFESSWYFFRFCDAHHDKPINKELVRKWMPVDHYIGGIEHAVMHLLYARFFTKVLRDLNYIDSHISEPFKRLTTQGMILHATFQKQNGEYIYPNEVYQEKDQYFHKNTKEEVIKGEVVKMSKSKKNTVDLDDMLNQFGLDAIKLFIISDTHPTNEMEWSISSLHGSKKFIDKLIKTQESLEDAKADASLEQKLHITIKKVEEAIEQMRLNSAISYIRELFNEFQKSARKPHSIFHNIVKLLYPFIPTTSLKLFDDADVWPIYNEKLTILNEVTIAVQVNGKLKGTINIKPEAEKEDVLKQVMDYQDIARHINHMNIVKSIYVPKRIINIIVRNVS